MKEEFVPYELALKLKQLGFNEEGFGMYGKNGSVLPLVPYTSEDKAILFQQAFRWFREKHQLDISINTVYSKYNDTLSKKYSGVIDDKSVFTNIGFYDAYEAAELACLDKLIEIETKQQEQ